MEKEIDELIRIELQADRAGDDLTTRMVVPEDMECSAVIKARQEGIISGQECAESVFTSMDRNISYSMTVRDGEKVKRPETVAEIRGMAAPVMAAERTALNFLGHLSGIATLSGAFTEKLRGTGIIVLDTRKTTPGLRQLEKKAVRDGGGGNHRMNLADYILVKENHIAAAGGLREVIRALGSRINEAEIEVDSTEMLEELLENPPGRIMLDNFSPEMVSGAVSVIGKLGENRPEIEVSGGITLENIHRYAIEGVDYISVGSLTASAPAFDLSMTVKGVG
ncbi:MAG: carboxylating nicotinate-nucleotide diphosphorylase [Candidatus Latescibacteria bacterium]|nr:carboxylating nicotinate-nucleotide diphosphorylase [bacterium]MBD3423682.1 carboxylating nicotinate-nucleotide diphosphorylase [Candidatus Latescibacterota bacterium]